MCVLCRAFGKELVGLWHTDAAFAWDVQAAASDSASDSKPTPAYANAESDNPASGVSYIDGVRSGLRWDENDTVTYSFPNARTDYEGGYGFGEPARGFSSISGAQMRAVNTTMARIEGMTELDIQRNDQAGISDGAADIRLATSSEANPTAYAYYPGNVEGGDVWFGTSTNYRNPLLGDYSYLTVIHELGHAFGLKHPHEGGGLGVTPRAYDSLEYSVMSYRSYTNGSVNGGYTNERFGYPQGYMRNDIAALQEMYGADFTFNDTNSLYTFHQRTGQMYIDGVGQGAPGANRIFLTIWDGGGDDTYRLSNFTNAVTIDLRPGMYSTTSAAQKAYLGDGHYAKGNVYNAYLYNNDPDSFIENAVGGRSNDKLIGNAADNVLNGAGGFDKMFGFAGDDTYVVNHARDLANENGGSGIDTIFSTISFSLLSGQISGSIENLTLGGTAIQAIGNTLNNVLTGNAGANRINGNSGDDRLVGGAGNDVLTGGADADTFVFGAGMDLDTIADFNPAQGDSIEISTALAVNFADLLGQANDVGSDTVIDFGGGDSLTLKSIAVADLNSADFLFV